MVCPRHLPLPHAHPGLPQRLHPPDIPHPRPDMEPRHLPRPQSHPLRPHRSRHLHPTFFEHGDSTPNGFGDFSMSAKYRILSANEQHGNYLLSAFVVATVPTGSYKNGATDASINPTLSGGKGFGRFDVITNLGGTLPTGGTPHRSLHHPTQHSSTTSANTSGQKLRSTLQPGTGAPATEKFRPFLPPASWQASSLSARRKPNRALASPLAVGFQTAATTYHTYNHSLIFTGRFLF